MSKERFLHVHKKFTQVWEGGSTLVNNKKDPGGITKYGVSLRFLKNIPLKDADLNKDGIIDWKDVASLTEIAQENIFFKYFWQAIKASELPNKLSMALYDTSVNLGVQRSIIMLQKVLGTQADGIIGPKTLKLAQNVSDVFEAVEALLNLRRSHYFNLAEKTEWADAFIKGWLRRTDALETFIKNSTAG